MDRCYEWHRHGWFGSDCCVPILSLAMLLATECSVPSIPWLSVEEQVPASWLVEYCSFRVFVMNC